MDIEDIISQAREIATKKRDLEARCWVLGTVKEFEGEIGVHDHASDMFKPWKNLGKDDLGLTILGSPGAPVTYLDSDEIRQFLPHLRKTGHIKEAMLSYSEATSGHKHGPRFTIEDADYMICSNWGLSQENAILSKGRTEKRNIFGKMFPEAQELLAEHHLEFHAYGKNGAPDGKHPAIDVRIEESYATMPEGREKAQCIVSSCVANVDHLMQVTHFVENNNLSQYLSKLVDTSMEKHIAKIIERGEVKKPSEKTR